MPVSEYPHGSPPLTTPRSHGRRAAPPSASAGTRVMTGP